MSKFKTGEMAILVEPFGYDQVPTSMKLVVVDGEGHAGSVSIKDIGTGLAYSVPPRALIRPDQAALVWGLRPITDDGIAEMYYRSTDGEPYPDNAETKRVAMRYKAGHQPVPVAEEWHNFAGEITEYVIPLRWVDGDVDTRLRALDSNVAAGEATDG